MFTSNIRTGEKSDFSDFVRGMAVGTRQRGLGILFFKFSLTAVARIYKKHTVNGSSVGGHGLLFSDEQKTISKYKINQF